MWQITATSTKTFPCGGTITKQLGTFCLDKNIFGIVSAEHAAKIAKDILNPWNDLNIELHVFAILIE